MTAASSSMSRIPAGRRPRRGEGRVRWSVVVRLYRRRLRARLGQELFAFTGIAVGVALLFAVQVSNSSLGSSISQLTNGLTGRAQLQVLARDPRGFPEPLVGFVQAHPDVQAV